MLRTVAVLALALAGTPAIASAGSAQTLGIDIGGPTPQIERLDRYVDTRPVAVSVRAPRASSVTLVGTSPAGGNLRVPLSRGAGGRYIASLALAAPGTWTLAIEASIAGGNAMTESFPLSVAAGATTPEIALMLLLAVLSTVGGIALIAATRTGRLHELLV